VDDWKGHGRRVAEPTPCAEPRCRALESQRKKKHSTDRNETGALSGERQ
jgi:hypothetical protein